MTWRHSGECSKTGSRSVRRRTDRGPAAPVATAEDRIGARVSYGAACAGPDLQPARTRMRLRPGLLVPTDRAWSSFPVVVPGPLLRPSTQEPRVRRVEAITGCGQRALTKSAHALTRLKPACSSGFSTARYRTEAGRGVHLPARRSRSEPGCLPSRGVGLGSGRGSSYGQRQRLATRRPDRLSPRGGSRHGRRGGQSLQSDAEASSGPRTVARRPWAVPRGDRGRRP